MNATEAENSRPTIPKRLRDDPGQELRRTEIDKVYGVLKFDADLGTNTDEVMEALRGPVDIP